MIRSVDLMIHNDLAEIAVVRDALDQLGSDLQVPMSALMQLQVALDEVVSNVVKYSWPDGGKHEVLVRITVNFAGGSPETDIEPETVPRPSPTPARAGSCSY